MGDVIRDLVPDQSPHGVVQHLPWEILPCLLGGCRDLGPFSPLSAEDQRLAFSRAIETIRKVWSNIKMNPASSGNVEIPRASRPSFLGRFFWRCSEAELLLQ